MSELKQECLETRLSKCPSCEVEFYSFVYSRPKQDMIHCISCDDYWFHYYRTGKTCRADGSELPESAFKLVVED